MKQLLLLFLITWFGAVFAQNETYYDRVFDSLVAKNEHQKGIVFFESELKKYPKNELILRSLGALNFRMKNLKEARSYYEKAVLVNPECSACYYYISQAYAGEENLEAALRSAEKGLAVNSKAANLYLVRGKLKLVQGDEIGALNDLSRAILYDPNEAVYYMERASFYVYKENLFSAKRDFLKALEIDPGNQDIYNYLAEIYVKENDFQQAVNITSRALERDSLNTKSLLGRGEVYFFMNEYDLAIKDYKKVIRLDPQNYYASGYLAEIYYKQEKMDEHCVEIARCLRLMEQEKIPSPEFYQYILSRKKEICDDSQASYYYQRGIASFRLEKYQEAMDFHNKALEKFPDEYIVYSFRGNAALYLGKNQSACSDYLKSLSHPDKVIAALLNNSGSLAKTSADSIREIENNFKTSTYVSLAFCYFNMGKTDSALICADLSLQYLQKIKDVEGPDAYFVKGILLLDKMNYAEAEKVFVEAAKISPDWSVFRNYIALALIGQATKVPLARNELQIRELTDLGQLHWRLPHKIAKESFYFSQALGQVETALKINPSDKWATYLRGYIKNQLGINACEDFKQANLMGYPVELNYLKSCK